VHLHAGRSLSFFRGDFSRRCPSRPWRQWWPVKQSGLTAANAPHRADAVQPRPVTLASVHARLDHGQVIFIDDIIRFPTDAYHAIVHFAYAVGSGQCSVGDSALSTPLVFTLSSAIDMISEALPRTIVGATA